MKNRKAPVMLFGIVVIAVGAMTIFNALQRPDTPEARQEKSEETAKEHKITDQDRTAAGNKLLAALGKGKKEKKNKPVAIDEATVANEMAKEPTIYLRSTTSYRPTPNEAATASHWYDTESNSARIAADNAKGKS